MAFSSFNDIISNVSSGNSFRADWYYRINATVPTSTSISAGAILSAFPGQYGTPNAFPGTSLAWVGCNDSAGNGTQIFGIPHGGNVSPSVKHLMNITTYTPPAGVLASGTMVLVDLQGYWANINLNTTSSQTLSGTPSLRYSNGEGCRLFLVTTSATSGATAQNATINYNNQLGNSRTISVTGLSVSSVRGQIISTTPHLANKPLFIPFTGGTTIDSGVANVSSIQMSATNTGTAALCLARPLAYVPYVSSVSYPTEREFLFQTPGIPRIYDGACLTWLYYTGPLASALLINTGFYGDIEFAWG